jgi:hypothetical protein
MRVTQLLVAAAVAAAAQNPDAAFLRKVTFEDRPSIVISNDKVDLTVVAKGGAMAEFVLRDDPERLNTMWNPTRMAREAGQQPRFGASLGHFVCVDGFGGVSPEERAAGLPGHGEAHLQPWEVRFARKEGKTATVTFTTHLPLVQENFVRTLRMVDGETVVYVHSELESLVGFDRPVVWAEHATIGSPFLEQGVTVVDLSGRRSQVRPDSDPPRPGGLQNRLASQKDFTWPMAPLTSGGKVDVRAAPTSLGVGGHTTTLMLDPAHKYAWVTALHPGKRLLLGYVFKGDEYPWLQSWENYPAPGMLARGLEFSTQPYDVPRREAIQLATMFDAPTYRWLPAKSKIESRFVMFMVRVPEGFSKVDHLTVENGRLVLQDRKTKKQVEVAASLPL